MNRIEDILKEINAADSTTKLIVDSISGLVGSGLGFNAAGAKSILAAVGMLIDDSIEDGDTIDWIDLLAVAGNIKVLGVQVMSNDDARG